MQTSDDDEPDGFLLGGLSQTQKTLAGSIVLFPTRGHFLVGQGGTLFIGYRSFPGHPDSFHHFGAQKIKCVFKGKFDFQHSSFSDLSRSAHADFGT